MPRLDALIDDFKSPTINAAIWESSILGADTVSLPGTLKLAGSGGGVLRAESTYNSPSGGGYDYGTIFLNLGYSFGQGQRINFYNEDWSNYYPNVRVAGGGLYQIYSGETTLKGSFTTTDTWVKFTLTPYVTALPYATWTIFTSPTGVTWTQRYTTLLDPPFAGNNPSDGFKTNKSQFALGMAAAGVGVTYYGAINVPPPPPPLTIAAVKTTRQRSAKQTVTVAMGPRPPVALTAAAASRTRSIPPLDIYIDALPPPPIELTAILATRQITVLPPGLGYPHNDLLFEVAGEINRERSVPAPTLTLPDMEVYERWLEVVLDSEPWSGWSLPSLLNFNGPDRNEEPHYQYCVEPTPEYYSSVSWAAYNDGGQCFGVPITTGPGPFPGSTAYFFSGKQGTADPRDNGRIKYYYIDPDVNLLVDDGSLRWREQFDPESNPEGVSPNIGVVRLDPETGQAEFPEMSGDWTLEAWCKPEGTMQSTLWAFKGTPLTGHQGFYWEPKTGTAYAEVGDGDVQIQFGANGHYDPFYYPHDYSGLRQYNPDGSVGYAPGTGWPIPPGPSTNPEDPNYCDPNTAIGKGVYGSYHPPEDDIPAQLFWGYHVPYNEGDRRRIMFNDDDGTMLNQWHHVVVIKYGIKVEYYVDGILRGENTMQPEELPEESSHIHGAYDLGLWLGSIPKLSGKDTLPSPDEITIVNKLTGIATKFIPRGALIDPRRNIFSSSDWYDLWNPGAMPFKGWIAEAIVYEHAISPSEIKQHYYTIVGAPPIFFLPSVAATAKRTRRAPKPTLEGAFLSGLHTARTARRVRSVPFPPELKIGGRTYHPPATAARTRSALTPALKVSGKMIQLNARQARRTRSTPLPTVARIVLYGPPNTIVITINAHETEIAIQALVKVSA